MEMEIRNKGEFRARDLIVGLGNYGLTETDQHLIGFLRRSEPVLLVNKARRIHYGTGGPKGYFEWLKHGAASRIFWEGVADAVSRSYRLTEDDKRAVARAADGKAGRELFAHAMTWFCEAAYIREDITGKGCRLLRYLDAQNIYETKLVDEVLSERYEDLRDVREVFVNFMLLVDMLLPSLQASVAKWHIGTSGTGDTGIGLSCIEKELLRTAHGNLKAMEPLVRGIIFK